MISDNQTDFETICDFGNLYKAYKKSKSGKGFNKSSARFQIAALDGIYQLKRRLETKTYQVSPYHQFTIYEPKERVIKACSFQDKIVQHSLCDNVLLPSLKEEFIPNNFAGQSGKGTLYGLDWLKSQMYLAYCKYGFDCWIVKADISKFFYNINHDILKDIVGYFVKDEDVYWLCERFIDSSEGIGLPLGNQISQVYALMYLSGLDHFITGELGVKYYGRYMDDTYIISNSKEELKSLLIDIQKICDELGIFINPKKTQIFRIDKGFTFLKIKYRLTETGHVVRIPVKKGFVREKRKLRKFKKLLDNGEMNYLDIEEQYKSWRGNIAKYDCHRALLNTDKLFNELFKNNSHNSH